MKRGERVPASADLNIGVDGEVVANGKLGSGKQRDHTYRVRDVVSSRFGCENGRLGNLVPNLT